MKLNSKCCPHFKNNFNKMITNANNKNFSQKSISIPHKYLFKLQSKNFSRHIFIHFTTKNFTENSFNSEKSSSNSDQRYFHEYESPQSQNISVTSFGYKLGKYLLIISTILISIYKFLLQKYNVLSKNNKWYLINDYYEMKLSQSASNFLKKFLEHYIYRQDSEESKLVYKVYKNLADKNKFPLIPTLNNIYVVHFVSIGACLFKNGDLFISDRIIELADNNEDQIAFFIATEMASCLMDNITKRIYFYYLIKNYGKYLLVEPKNAKITSLSFTGYKRDSLNFFNYLLHFYPENVISTYYEEYEIMRVAFKLLHKAEYDLSEVKYLNKLY